MYLTYGLLIGLLSVFLPSAIGVLFTKQNVGRTLIWAFVVGLLYGGFLAFSYWFFAVDFYGPTPGFGSAVIGFVIAAFIAGSSEEDAAAATPGITLAVFLLVWMGVVSFNGNNFNKSTEKGKLLQVEVKKVSSKIMDLADPVHICLVDENMAKSKAEKALGQVKTEDNANAGSRYQLGNGTKQFIDGQLWWIFPLEFTSYWQWSSFPNVPGYIRVSAEDPMSEAQAIQTDTSGKPIIIKYLNSAYRDSYVERYLRNNGYLKLNINDFTFEVDDSWRPYYTISQREWTIGYGGDVVTNVIVFDLQTGTFVSCPINQVTKKFPWIDRANDIDVIDYQTKQWGEYAEVGWKITSRYDGKRKKPTDGWYMTYDNGKCYWFTGWTSYSASSDLIGVSLTDANTGKTVYYPTQGSTEEVAYQIANGHWSNFQGYTPTELVPYNIYGMLTYVIPIAYNSTQFVGVSLVSVINKDINAKGKTLEEALSLYRSAMGSVGSDRGVPYEGQPKKLSITAKVQEVGMSFVQGQSQMYPFTLVGVDKIFQINYSLQNAKASFLQPGREVLITYMDTKEKVITCLTFDIPGIKLSDKNPGQAKWIEAQKSVKAETNRVSNIQENQEIIDSGNLGDVNPEDLKKFIELQKAKKK